MSHSVLNWPVWSASPDYYGERPKCHKWPGTVLVSSTALCHWLTKISHHLNQSAVRPKPITTCQVRFPASGAGYRLRCQFSLLHCVVFLPSFVFGFTTHFIGTTTCSGSGVCNEESSTWLTVCKVWIKAVRGNAMIDFHNINATRTVMFRIFPLWQYNDVVCNHILNFLPVGHQHLALCRRWTPTRPTVSNLGFDFALEADGFVVWIPLIKD